MPATRFEAKRSHRSTRWGRTAGDRLGKAMTRCLTDGAREAARVASTESRIEAGGGGSGPKRRSVGSRVATRCQRRESTLVRAAARVDLRRRRMPCRSSSGEAADAVLAFAHDLLRR
ncbi:unnamed protein product [Urochloa humidicola]